MVQEAVNVHLDKSISISLFFSLPVLKIGGYAEGCGEDSFVRDILAPLLDTICMVDINIKRVWYAKYRVAQTYFFIFNLISRSFLKGLMLGFRALTKIANRIPVFMPMV